MHLFRPLALAAIAPLALAAAHASAAGYRVTVTGEIERNDFISGTFAGIPAGAPVTMTMLLDDTDFLDSPNLPGVTRGYRFTPADFSLTVGTVSVGLRTSPVPPNAYFVLRNNDPRADGFFISQGTDIDVEIPLNMVPSNYGIAFSRTFNSIPPTPPGGNDPTLNSLELSGAVGCWGFENLSVYNFTIQLGEFSTPLLIEYQTICVERLCDTIDFNNDGLFPDDQDLVDFLSVLAGGACSTSNCNTIDFNGDGLFPDDADLVSFLNVLAGGAC